MRSRLAWGLTGVALVAVFALGRLAWRRASRGSDAAPTNERAAEDDAPGAQGRAPASAALPRFRSSVQPSGTSPGHVRVRVHGRFGTGVMLSLPNLEVVADDGRTCFDAASLHEGGPDDAAYVVHLPPGTYSLLAIDETGVDAGIAGPIVVEAGATSTVDLRLEPAVTIDGTVRASDGAPVEASLHARRVGGCERVTSDADAEEHSGAFSLSGLMRGERYLVELEAPGGRDASLVVAAPSTDVRLTVARGVRIEGAIGVEPGAACPVDRLTVSRPGDDGEARELLLVPVDRRCRFRIDGLAPVAFVQLTASGGGWHFDARVPIPPEGDPAPVCLNPPCLPVDERRFASLEVVFVGGEFDDSLGTNTTSVVVRTSDGRMRGCGGTGACVLEDLPSGATVVVNAHGGSCSLSDHRLTLQPGPNVVRATCRQARRVQGLVRGAGGGILVRCASAPRMTKSFDGALFDVRCPADETAVEVRRVGESEGDSTWQRVPVNGSTEPIDVAFGPSGVEL